MMVPMDDLIRVAREDMERVEAELKALIAVPKPLFDEEAIRHKEHALNWRKERYERLLERAPDAAAVHIEQAGSAKDASGLQQDEKLGDQYDMHGWNN